MARVGRQLSSCCCRSDNPLWWSRREVSGRRDHGLFRWPEAHENDAERTARAGLTILEAVSKLNEQSTNTQISVRVGIDSGAVVVGSGAGNDADVFRETP